MRRIGKYRRKKQKKVIIVSALSLLLLLTLGYAAFQTNLSITAKGNVKEKSRIIQAWEETSQTDFHSDFYKQNIVSATFLDNTDVPSNATESWNVSEDQEHGGVMAWVVPNNEDSTKYDLYIGAKDGVIANKNSAYLFRNFESLIMIDFQDNLDTSQVTNMVSMFYNCRSLTKLDLSCFDTKKVVTMGSMFYGCHLITELNLSTFDTTNVMTFDYMFYDCDSLIVLNLDNFNTLSLTNLSHMFYHCDNLETIILCGFDTSQVTNMINMFRSTPKLKYVYVGTSWTTTYADITNMFYNSGVSSVTTGQC